MANRISVRGGRWVEKSEEERGRRGGGWGVREKGKVGEIAIITSILWKSFFQAFG